MEDMSEQESKEAIRGALDELIRQGRSLPDVEGGDFLIIWEWCNAVQVTHPLFQLIHSEYQRRLMGVNYAEVNGQWKY